MSASPSNPSPPALSGATDVGTVTAADRVLAAGHLHPGMLFIRLVEGLRQSILPVAVAVFAGQLWLAVASAVLLVFGLAFAVLRFVTFRYRLTEQELVTTEGVLQRQERRIPVDRIQDLSFESSLLRRLTGLVVVSVETASGQGAEARLDSLGRRDAQALRQTLLRLRGRVASGAIEGATADRALVLHRASLGDLVLLGLTDNRLGAILVGLLGVLELGDQFGLLGGFDVAVGPALEAAAGLGTALLLMLGLGVLLLALIAGWAFAIAGSVVLYHGFRLIEREQVLQRSYGLLTRRVQSLPRRRIQRISIEATPLRRLFDRVSVRADSAGSGQQAGDSGGSRDVVLPLAERRRALDLIAYILPGAQLFAPRWRPVSRKVVLRTGVKGTAIGAVLAVAAWGPLGIPAAVVVMVVGALVGLLAGVAHWRNLGYALLDNHAAFRWGILGRYEAVVPHRKIQAVVLRANPFERVAGLARLTVLVAGGSPTTLPGLPRGEARTLRDHLAGLAERSPFVW